MQFIPEKTYLRIIGLLPIVCVDLVVMNRSGEILLLKRKNEPFRNKWWFPGGRVHFMETREEAAFRKLKQECGLKGKIIKVIGTYDIILKSKAHTSHALTTVFQILCNNDQVKTDTQSVAFRWLLPKESLKIAHSKFVKTIIKGL